MIGAWSTFGQGPLPNEGEAIVMVLLGTPVHSLMGSPGEVVPAIFRGGTLFTQDGRTLPIPFGSAWTSLPHPSLKS